MSNQNHPAGELLWKILERLCVSVSGRFRKKTGVLARTFTPREAVMETVFAHPEGIMLKDIARAVNRTAGAVSQIVESLVRDNLVTRGVSRRDRRATIILPTRLGEERRREYFACMEDTLAEALTSVDPGEREVFARVLRSVGARLAE